MAIEVRAGMSNFIPMFHVDVIIYPCPNLDDSNWKQIYLYGCYIKYIKWRIILKKPSPNQSHHLFWNPLQNISFSEDIHFKVTITIQYIIFLLMPVSNTNHINSYSFEFCAMLSAIIQEVSWTEYISMGKPDSGKFLTRKSPCLCISLV